ncbi:hypothetical protein CsSME_00039689 [Camellia sinensis var. sinensis]
METPLGNLITTPERAIAKLTVERDNLSVDLERRRFNLLLKLLNLVRLRRFEQFTLPSQLS